MPVCRKSCSKPAVERILEFGKELYSMSQRLKTDKNTKQHNQQMLEVSINFYLRKYGVPTYRVLFKIWAVIILFLLFS